jgi:hypothetical protein
MSNLSSFYPTGAGGNLRVRRNFLINGNFDVWQRGASHSGAGYGSADRWLISFEPGDAITVSKSVSGNHELYRTKNRMKADYTGGSGSTNYCFVAQKIEDVRTGAGKMVSMSMMVYAIVDDTEISIEVAQNFGTSGSSTVMGIGVKKFLLKAGWNTLTHTFQMPSIEGKTIGTNNFVWMIFWLSAGSGFDSRTDSLGQQSGTVYLAQCQLEEGLSSSPYDFEPYSDVLRQCQRYYEVCTIFTRQATATIGEYLRVSVRFKEKKRAIPTRSVVLSTSGGFSYSGVNDNQSDDAVHLDYRATAILTSSYWYGSVNLDAEL